LLERLITLFIYIKLEWAAWIWTKLCKSSHSKTFSDD